MTPEEPAQVNVDLTTRTEVVGIWTADAAPEPTMLPRPRECDPATSLFAGMLASLAGAALANAGKTHADLAAALDEDEALFAAYAAAPGLPAGDDSPGAVADGVASSSQLTTGGC